MCNKMHCAKDRLFDNCDSLAAVVIIRMIFILFWDLML